METTANDHSGLRMDRGGFAVTHLLHQQHLALLLQAHPVGVSGCHRPGAPGEMAVAPAKRTVTIPAQNEYGYTLIGRQLLLGAAGPEAQLMRPPMRYHPPARAYRHNCGRQAAKSSSS